ncbi:hypothetical protein ILYODFUR_013513 [Ilyodon furcidens]|uniref:Uncharacterized protein n=1 Tax=Ilyodon furcidens TaxID=33524 RepID=A0ABV0TJI6_9TELE
MDGWNKKLSKPNLLPLAARTSIKCWDYSQRVTSLWRNFGPLFLADLIQSHFGFSKTQTFLGHARASQSDLGVEYKTLILFGFLSHLEADWLLSLQPTSCWIT